MAAVHILGKFTVARKALAEDLRRTAGLLFLSIYLSLAPFIVLIIRHRVDKNDHRLIHRKGEILLDDMSFPPAQSG